MKERRNRSAILLLLHETLKNGKLLIALDLLIGFLRESQNVVDMVFPAMVLNLLLGSDSVAGPLTAVGVVSLFLAVLAIFIEFIQRKLQNHSLRVLNYIILGLNQKAMRIHLFDAERNETYEQYDKAYDGIWNSMDVHFMIFSVIIPKLFVLSLTFYIFCRTNILVAFVVFATIVAEYFINKAYVNKKSQFDFPGFVFDNQRKYVEDTMFDQRSLRDMVFNNAKDFFARKRNDILGQAFGVAKSREQLNLKLNCTTAAIALARTLMIYGAGIYKYARGKLLISDFLLFTGAAQQMTYAIFQISNALVYLHQAGIYLQTYNEYTQKDEMFNAVQDAPPPLQKPRTLEFRNVSFRYPNQEGYALHNVSAKIDLADTITIVGDNGAGKSTFVKLFLRLYPVTEGEILLDGVNIETYSYSDYARLFAPVFQDFVLFYYSIAENISFDRRLSAEQYAEVLAKVGLSARVDAAPKGVDSPYSTQYEDDGVIFSGGEEQRLAIARALAREYANVLVMDEPTASLDPIAEYEINNLAFRAGARKSAIFISHRLSTARMAQKILVFDRGEIVEYGSHEELYRDGGLYRQMYDMQSSYYR